MIKKESRKLSDAMARQGIINKEDTAVYAYGLELVIATFIGIIAVIIISIIFSKPLAGLFYLAAFIPLRSTAGGYHATTHLYCFISFSVSFALLLLGAIQLSEYINPLYLILISALNLIAIFILSPIGTSQKPLTEEKRRLNRKRSLVLAVSFLFITSASYLIIDYIELFTFFALGQLAAMISLLIAVKIKR